MEVDLLIENGIMVIPKVGSVQGCLGIIGEKIVGIYDHPRGIVAREKIDARGNYILPGLIEPHAHYGFFGSFAEHFKTETASAAIGGITTVIPFYRSYTGQTTVYEDFPALKAKAEENACIDFSFHLGILTQDQLANVGKYCSDYGITSFKFYMAYKGEESKSIGMAENETDDGFLLEAFSALAKIPAAVGCVHAENIEIIVRLAKKFKQEGKDGLRTWSECRPNLAEAESVQRAMIFARAAGCPLYIVHLSTREALDEVKRFRVGYPNIFVETCPQYLTLTQDSPVGNLGKVNPPLRTREDNEELWKGISDGFIDTIGTDHCAVRRETKMGDIWHAVTGFPGSATMLPVLLSEGVNKGRISLEKVAEVTSFNASRIFNLFPKKGTIQIGSDADICIIDMNLSKKVEADMLQSHSDFSLYEGWTLRGWPILTVVRGKVIMQDGRVVGPAGYGHFIRT